MDVTPVQNIPFEIIVSHKLRLIWLYRSEQVLKIPLVNNWVLMVCGDGLKKFDNVTHAAKQLEGKDYKTAFVNLMSVPIPNADYTDGFDLVAEEGNKDSIELVNADGVHRHVCYYNISVPKLPLSCTTFLKYDPLQGTFTIHDQLTNNVRVIDDPTEECKQIISFLCNATDKRKMEEKELTPVRDKNMFFKHDCNIKHLYSSFRNLSVAERKRYITRKYSKNQILRKLHIKKAQIKSSKKRWSEKSWEFLKERKKLTEEKRALSIAFRIHIRQLGKDI